MLETFKLIRPRRRAARRARIIATAALVVVGLSLATPRPREAYGLPQEHAQKLNRLVAQSGSTPAMKVFAEGRDFLDNNEWAKAAGRFQSFIKSYPKDKDVDAAYYWLAYTLNKQGRKQEAMSWLDRLLQEFPKSGWRDEAKALVVELGDPRAVRQAIDDKENNEIKLIALQSLLENSPERAMQYISEMLKSPNTSPQMRESVVSILGSHGGRQAVPILLQLARTDPSVRIRQTAIRRLGEDGGEAVIDDLRSIYQADRDAGVKAQVLRALSEMDSARAKALLLEVARNTTEDAGLRQTAIRRLGERHDTAVADLTQIYDADRSREIRAQILRAFSEMDDPRAAQKLVEAARSNEDPELRAFAIRRLGERNDETVVDELTRIFDAEQSGEIRAQILRAFSEMKSPRARAKLMEIARGAGDPTLRAFAIRRLAESGDSVQTVDVLSSLYDSERNMEIKVALLRGLGESGQKAALRKLMDVARRDPSVEMRKLAIRLVGESKDPEALKFLEELLKP
ncbi:MAG: HEAT repeat domain-containing protein [Acidobacteria bacterium]|nr:HEAT repeat domain-containing protein [Acidobacteriota bacterium]